MQKKSKLSLVGAGPGDPELLTRKGWRVILNADVILYDALVSDALMDEIPAEIPRMYVGKRCGQHALSQNEINQLIVAYGKTYGHVVRLKGGDPLVFGRGQEEIDHARLHEMETEIVPGISSTIGVPGACGIPVTRRGCADSFWVLSATTQNHEISRDFDLAAQSSATLLILMGTQKLAELVAQIRLYRSPATPIALIQNGTLPHEKVILGNLDDILVKAVHYRFGSPGIIVVGDVVTAHPEYKQEIHRILSELGCEFAE